MGAHPLSHASHRGQERHCRRVRLYSGLAPHPRHAVGACGLVVVPMAEGGVMATYNCPHLARLENAKKSYRALRDQCGALLAANDILRDRLARYERIGL